MTLTHLVSASLLHLVEHTCKILHIIYEQACMTLTHLVRASLLHLVEQAAFFCTAPCRHGPQHV